MSRAEPRENAYSPQAAGKVAGMAWIASVGTSVPRHRMTRGQVREICLSIFRDLPEVDRLIEVVDHAGVDARYLCFPPSYYLQ